MPNQNITQAEMSGINQSINQLCTQMALNNVVVPKFTNYSNAFDFLSDYEVSTVNCTEDQKRTLLLQAFATCDSKAWVMKDLKEMIDGQVSWKELKESIIERHTGTNSLDKHFKRLRELTFDPDGHRKLLDFVEDILDAYGKAHPYNNDEMSSIRYARAAIPSSLKPVLGLIPDYATSTNLGKFKKAIHQYDVTRASGSPKRSVDRNNVMELANVIRDLVDSVRKDNELTRKTVVAALKPPEGKPRSRDNSPGRYSSQYNRSNQGNYYTQQPLVPNTDQNRQAGPVNNATRSPSPQRKWPQQAKPDQPLDNNSGNNLAEKNNPFDSSYYYGRFGLPPRPCKCSGMHWERHCLFNLKE